MYIVRVIYESKLSEATGCDEKKVPETSKKVEKSFQRLMLILVIVHSLFFVIRSTPAANDVCNQSKVKIEVKKKKELGVNIRKPFLGGFLILLFEIHHFFMNQKNARVRKRGVDFLIYAINCFSEKVERKVEDSIPQLLFSSYILSVFVSIFVIITDEIVR